MSGIENLYSKEFALRLAAIRLRSFMPAEVHDELDIFENEEQDKIVSIRTQCVYDAVVLFFNALTQLNFLEFPQPRVRCDRGFWGPGSTVIKQMKEVCKFIKLPNASNLLLNYFS